MKWILGLSVLALAAAGVASAQESAKTNVLPNAPSASQSVPNYQPIPPSGVLAGSRNRRQVPQVFC